MTDTESRDSENICQNISWVCLLAGGLLTAFNGFFFDRNKIQRIKPEEGGECGPGFAQLM